MNDLENAPNGFYLRQLRNTVWQVVGIYAAVIAASAFVSYVSWIARP